MKKIFCLLMLSAQLSQAQTISTLAGTGIAGYTGDGGPATAATLNHSHSVTYDAAGNLYLADVDNNCIRRIGTGGVITTVAGTGVAGSIGDGGPATTAKLNAPFTMKFDAAGKLIIADDYNLKVRVVDASGIITTIAGNGISGYSGDGGPATAARFSSVTGLAIDASGNIYVTDQLNHCVRKITVSTGIITTVAGTGVPGFSGDGGAAASAQLHLPNFLTFDVAGNLYVSDNQNSRIRKIDAAGIITTVAGNGAFGHTGDGGPATSASLNYPGGVSFDISSNMYIADNINNCVRMINTAGVISTVAGTAAPGYSGDGGAATAAELRTVTDVCINSSGNMVIAEFGNHVVREVAFCTGSAISGQPIADTVSIGSIATFSVTTTMVSPLYQWQQDAGSGFTDLANGPVYSGVTTNTLTINNAAASLDGTQYRCVITNGASCMDISSVALLTVIPPTGIHQFEIMTVDVYPNPSHGSVHVMLPANTTGGTVHIFNQMGQLLFSSQINGYASEIPLDALPVGVYLMRIEANGQKVVKKLTKE